MGVDKGCVGEQGVCGWTRGVWGGLGVCGWTKGSVQVQKAYLFWGGLYLMSIATILGTQYSGVWVDNRCVCRQGACGMDKGCVGGQEVCVDKGQEGWTRGVWDGQGTRVVNKGCVGWTWGERVDKECVG